MSSEWEQLKKVLSVSTEQYGTKPLTNVWLLNMMNMVDRLIEAEKKDVEEVFYHYTEHDATWGKD